MIPIGVRAPPRKRILSFLFSSPSPTTFPTMSSSPMMYSSDLDSRGSSDLFSSRSSVFRDPGLFSLSDSGLAISGDRNDSNRRFFPPDNGLISHGQDTATMFSSSSMVCYVIRRYSGCLLHHQKSVWVPRLLAVFHPSLRTTLVSCLR